MDNNPIQTQPPVPPTNPPPTPNSVAPLPTVIQADQPGRAGSKKMMIILIIVIVLVLILGAGAYYYLNYQSKPPAPAQTTSAPDQTITNLKTEINNVNIDDPSGDFSNVDKDLQTL